jgi:chemotaxis protein MotB
VSEGTRPLIVVKRIKRYSRGHHGGAWKIAYADFVTAMMAFFLLMWLLGSTTKGDLQGIAEFFQTPLKVALSGGQTSGDTTSVLQGGGPDFTRQTGQGRRSDGETTLAVAEAAIARHDRHHLEELKAKLERTIEANPLLKQFRRQILLDITDEGLRIQIVDENNRPMFATGSALLLPHTREILHEIGKALNDVGNKVSLSGHTDATPYSSGERGYSNWELSADRANASRRELIAGGMDERKVLRVVGLASAVLFDKSDPFAPVNRRISIVVLNKRAESSMSRDESMRETSSTEFTGKPQEPPQPQQQ